MRKFILPPVISVITIIACTQNDKNNPAVMEMNSPAADSCAEPFLFTGQNNKVYLSWVQKKGKLSSLMFSSLESGKWTEPVNIAKGTNWFVNWADYPVVITDGGKNFIAHYLERSDTGKYTYDIKLVQSSDGGKTWTQQSILHDDGKKAEHGFVSMLPYHDDYFVCWLDGRKAAVDHDTSDHAGHHGEMTLRAAVIGKDGVKKNEWQLDERVCDCCQTTAAITTSGPVVIYRDRSEEEVRDMSVAKYLNGKWTQPVSIFKDGWKINACPVNGPRADASGNHLAVAWFTMPDNKAQVNVIFSVDGGANFGKPIRVDEGRPIGRVDLLMLNDTTALVSWMEGPSIKAVKVYSNGTKETPIMIASSSEVRASGFPQMTRSGNNIIFAWTDEKEKRIKVAGLSL